jgi:Zn-dependent metalloprotease
VNLDIVAHEMFHGVTEATARIEYANESGALNESYSDIFGVIIANFNKPDARTWNFEVGMGLFVSGQAVRDLRDPARLGQPAHMNQFRVKPNTREGDFGGVHTNSGIHNRAAFLILTAADAAGRPVLTPKEVAAIFYLALAQQLSRTSGFGDSRRGVLLAARTLFRRLTRSQQDKKVKAIEKAFSAVGIEDS